MDNFLQSSEKDPSKNIEEDINNNYESAPPLLPQKSEKSEPPTTLEPGTAEPYTPNTNNEENNSDEDKNSDEEYSSEEENNPENQQNNNRNRNRMRIRRRHIYYKATTCERVLQIFFTILLYTIVILSILLQILDKLNILCLIDDVLLSILATIMLVYSIKGYSTRECKIGCYTLTTMFIGFGVRGIGMALITKNGNQYFTLFLFRSIVIFCLTGFNCNQLQELTIEI